MEEQGNQMDIPVFQEDFPAVEQNQQEEFIEAMIEARNDNGPIQAFQDLINGAPPLSVEALCDLTEEFTSHPNVVRLLLKHVPKIARCRSNGDLLLHRAIHNREAVVESIELILDAYSQAISEKDNHGLLPLHLACERERSVQALEQLLSRYPGAASISPENWDGDFPLHLCLRDRDFKPNISGSFMLDLIDAYPEAASIKTRRNKTALHLACESGFSLAIVQRLYQLYPEAVTVHVDDTGDPPLHSATRSVDLVKFLIDKYPEGAQSKGRSGMLPLHRAAMSAPLKVLEMLIDAYPSALNVADNQGELPLHSAGMAGAASHEAIQLLADRFVGDERHHNGLGVADKLGRLPIHWFLQMSQDIRPGTVRRLLDLYPGSTNVADILGMLPLHCACLPRDLELEIIRLLVEAAPYSVIQKTRKGRTPYQLASPRRNRKIKFVEVETYLLERQNQAMADIEEAFADVTNMLGLPDLVIANIWSFATPDL